ncbi:MAG: tetratricopeptide repeat protein [Pseudomonadota bacterium]
MSQSNRLPATRFLAGVAVIGLLSIGGTAVASDPVTVDAHSHAGAYLSGTIAAARSDYSAAASFMRDVLETDTDNDAVLSEALRLSLFANGVADALPLAYLAEEQELDNELVDFLLFVEAMDGDDFERAAALVEAMERTGVTWFSLPFAEAWVAAGQGDVVAADAALDEIRDTNGFSGLAHLHLALIFDLENQTAPAETEYRLALESARTELLVEALASLLSRDGRSDEAIELLSEVVEAGNQSIALASALERLENGETVPRPVGSAGVGLGEALYQIASALMQEDATEIALQYVRFAQFLWPEAPQIQLLLADALRAADATEDALAAYAILETGTRHGNLASLRRAAMLGELERYDQALEELAALAESTPDAAEPHVQRGDLLRVQRRFDEAVEAYDVAAERQPELVQLDWTFLYRRGIALERAGLWDRAEQDFIHAIDINPDNGYLLNYLGYSWADRGINVDEAEELLLRAIELQPEDGFIADSVGWVYYRTGRLDEAIEWLELAVTLEPGDPEINDHLGDAYWVAGRLVEARFQWRRALSSDTDEERIAEIEAKLRDGLLDDGILVEDEQHSDAR